MRRIDGDALKEVIRSNAYVVDYSETGAIYGMYVDGIEYEIDAQPTIEPERKKGKWIDYSDEGYVECPFCHSATNCDGNKDELHFCFSCGADMRGEQE